MWFDFWDFVGAAAAFAHNMQFKTDQNMYCSVLLVIRWDLIFDSLTKGAFDFFFSFYSNRWRQLYDLAPIKILTFVSYFSPSATAVS